jgi:hypothetical protein
MRLEPNHVSRDGELGCILDRDDPVRFPDSGSESIEHSRLSRSRRTSDEDVVSCHHTVPENLATFWSDRSLTNEGVKVGHGWGEPPDRHNGSVNGGGWDNRMQPRPVAEPRIHGRRGRIDTKTQGGEEPPHQGDNVIG